MPKTLSHDLQVISIRHWEIRSTHYIPLIQIISYLLFDEPEWKGLSKKVDQHLNHGLLDYAARHWVVHFQEAKIMGDDSVLNLAVDVCDLGSNQVFKWFSMYWCLNRSNSDCRQNFTSLMVASYFGLQAIIKLLITKDSVMLNLRDCKGRTPLLWAAKGEHLEVVKLLLAKDDIELNPLDEWGQTPLSQAAGSGHSEVVKLLSMSATLPTTMK